MDRPLQKSNWEIIYYAYFVKWANHIHMPEKWFVRSSYMKYYNEIISVKNLLQRFLSSSEPSPQSFCVSHINADGIHKPLLWHWNSPVLQLRPITQQHKITCSAMLRYKIKSPISKPLYWSYRCYVQKYVHLFLSFYVCKQRLINIHNFFDLLFNLREHSVLWT